MPAFLTVQYSHAAAVRPGTPDIAGWWLKRALMMALGGLAGILGVSSASASGAGAVAFGQQLEHELILPIVAETPGAAVVIVVDGAIVLQKTYGYRVVGEAQPIDTETLFRVASISKTFAAAAAAIMVNDGTTSWQAPVVQSVSNLQFKRSDYGARINLQHLMSQSTGLMPHAYTNLIEGRLSYPKIVQRLHKVDFVCPPGECYSYQNVAFSLVGDVVEAQAGTDYPSFVSNRIFTPLAMRRASFGRQAFISDANHAKPHVRDGDSWQTTLTTANYYKVAPAAGVNASIEDMTAWLMAQLGQRPQVLSVPMLDAMQTRVIDTTRQQAHYRWRRGLGKTGYGLGWRVFDYASETDNVHHGGYVRGMRSEMVFNRKRQTGLVFLTNSEPGVINDLVFSFLDMYRDYRVANPARLATSGTPATSLSPSGLADGR